MALYVSGEHTVVEVEGKGWAVVNEKGTIADRFDTDLLWWALQRAAEYTAGLRRV
jgi:hypothetical protein